jgi:putative acetyltransferase
MSNPTTETLIFRDATPTDINDIHRIHIASIRGLCIESYDRTLIEIWATSRDLARYQRMFAAGSRCVVVIRTGVICGFGSISLETLRLASLFMHPDQAGKGIGKLLLNNLEQVAGNAGIAALQVSASLNARNFYARQGYRQIALGKHSLADGIEMDCIEMLKSLRQSDTSQQR